MTNNLTRGVDMGKRICSVDDCETVHYAKGYCNRHWARWRKYGDPNAARAPMGPSAQTRVAVDKKTCSLCAEQKPAGAFSKRASAVDGLYSWCKPCQAAKQSVYYNAHREELIAKSKAAADVDPAGVVARSRAAYERRGDLYRRRARDWRLANPDKASAAGARRRARIAASVEIVDLESLWTGTCPICATPIDRDLVYPDPMSRSVDHILPLSKGGAHKQDNLQWTHLVCNLRKHATLPEELVGESGDADFIPVVIIPLLDRDGE